MRTRIAILALLAPTSALAQPRANAGVRGLVLDASGEPALDVAVSVPDTGYRTRTDLDGRYELRLPPGRYTVRAAFDRTMVLRAAYGATLARPIVREVAPFLYPDFVRNRTVQGNPDLRTTSVHNADVRWELYPGPGEVVAASVFMKAFIDPIERVILDRNGNVTFDNVDGAQNYGAELEGRVSLGRLARPLRHLFVNANLSLIYSRVSLSPAQQVNATNAERPLAGQSPWVVNVGVGYQPSPRFSANVFYNVFGPRIEDVGRFGLPDTYREPLHTLDATVQWDPSPRFGLRLAARNIAAQPLVFTQGPLEVLRSAGAASVSLRAQLTY